MSEEEEKQLAHQNNEDEQNRLMDLHNQISECNWTKIQYELRNLKNTQYIFEENYKELATHFNSFQYQGKIDLRPNLTPVEYENIQLKSARYLYNYLSAARTLYHHTVVFMNKYKNTSFEKDAMDKVSSHFPDELNKFLPELRNYMVHQGLFHHCILTDITTQPREIRVVFKINELLNSHKWSENSKKYILSWDGDFELEQFCEDYHEKATEYYTWFFSALRKYHYKDLKEYEKLKNEYVLLKASEYKRRQNQCLQQKK